EPESTQVAQHDVCDAALLAGRAGDRSELGEEVERLGHAPILRPTRQTATRSPVLIRARSSAAPTKPRKRDAARVGRDLNSGWNWLATNHGWSASSTISTSRPFWNVPLTTSPASIRRSR